MLTVDSIFSLAKIQGVIRSSDLIERFTVSRQYASRLLSRLVRERKLIKIGSTRSASYVTRDYLENNPQLNVSSYTKSFVNSSLEEHTVITDIERNFFPLSTCPENIKSIFEYAFSEMFNNAIEHSQSQKITFTVRLHDNILSFVVDDFGIGVFRNIMKKRALHSEIEAIQDLLKGKTTTAPTMHSGEGIFFTSKVCDEYILDSYGYQFIANNTIHDIFIKKVIGQKQGTRVTFHINLSNPLHLNDIFKQYTNIGEDTDYGFDKTEIRVRLYMMGGVHISRSQARRVLSGLEKFKLIVMDYDQVPTVGQAFADEIYRVFANKHPTIRIQDQHANEAVSFMIERAKTEAKKE